jgi:hypothetical protein
MTIPSFEVTLIYADGSTWFAGAFPSMDAVNAWVSTAQAAPNWVSTTTIQTVDKSFTVTAAF